MSGPVLDQILPQRIENTHRGHRLALWLFAIWGLSQLVFSVLGVLALSLRRRADSPLQQ